MPIYLLDNKAVVSLQRTIELIIPIKFFGVTDATAILPTPVILTNKRPKGVVLLMLISNLQTYDAYGINHTTQINIFLHMVFRISLKNLNILL